MMTSSIHSPWRKDILFVTVTATSRLPDRLYTATTLLASAEAAAAAAAACAAAAAESLICCSSCKIGETAKHKLSYRGIHRSSIEFTRG